MFHSLRLILQQFTPKHRERWAALRMGVWAGSKVLIHSFCSCPPIQWCLFWGANARFSHHLCLLGEAGAGAGDGDTHGPNSLPSESTLSSSLTVPADALCPPDSLTPSIPYLES